MAPGHAIVKLDFNIRVVLHRAIGPADCRDIFHEYKCRRQVAKAQHDAVHPFGFDGLRLLGGCVKNKRGDTGQTASFDRDQSRAITSRSGEMSSACSASGSWIAGSTVGVSASTAAISSSGSSMGVGSDGPISIALGCKSADDGAQWVQIRVADQARIAAP